MSNEGGKRKKKIQRLDGGAKEQSRRINNDEIIRQDEMIVREESLDEEMQSVKRRDGWTLVQHR